MIEQIEFCPVFSNFSSILLSKTLDRELHTAAFCDATKYTRIDYIVLSLRDNECRLACFDELVPLKHRHFENEPEIKNKRTYMDEEYFHDYTKTY